MITEALTRQLGPLQTWQWGAVAGGGYLLYRVVSGKGLFSSSGVAAPTVPGSDSGVGGNTPLPNPVVTPPGGGPGQADPGGHIIIPTVPKPVTRPTTIPKTIIKTVTTPTAKSPHIGTSTMPVTRTPTTGLTGLGDLTQIKAQQQIVNTYQHHVKTVAVNAADDVVASSGYKPTPAESNAHHAKTVAANAADDIVANPANVKQIIAQKNAATAAHKAKTVAANAADDVTAHPVAKKAKAAAGGVTKPAANKTHTATTKKKVGKKTVTQTQVARNTSLRD